MTNTTDSLSTTPDQFPLGRSALPLATGIGSAACRPFGATLAVAPAETAAIELDALSYDADRQIGLIHDGDQVVPLARHTDGRTSTTTASRDGTPQDGDADVRED
ncbi:putative ATP-grasp-modified RiPP [Actinocatenispora thailandica]|uniref:putative ATP-grasp-modified RiPP n=1 Tax=Actinocatenispora thailandica TaxID=227318 RepID=UPI001EF33BA9|nr:putative ATP-grasp-modified RiPP [Actinocatenispora thailandica]